MIDCSVVHGSADDSDDRFDDDSDDRFDDDSDDPVSPPSPAARSRISIRLGEVTC